MDTRSWHLLPPDLIELQIGQIDLLLAMYPDEAVVEDSSRRTLDSLRQSTENIDSHKDDNALLVTVLLQLPLDDGTSNNRTLQLDLSILFSYQDDETPHEPPFVRVRVQQPPWLNKTAASQLMTGAPGGDDVLGTIEHIKEAALQELERALNASSTAPITENDGYESLVRVWFYFPSISTRSKRDDFIKYAPLYHLTGFLYAGKPGLLCVEGGSQSIDDYMKYIKTESWGDIPAHHKKVSERHRENIDARVFHNMTETTDMVGERRGQRANRGDMKAMEEWLVERGLGDAFGKVLM